MFGKLLTDGGGATDIGYNGLHVHRRLGGRGAEDALPASTSRGVTGGTGCRAIGKRSARCMTHGHDATAMAIQKAGRPRSVRHAFHFRDAIVLGQPFNLRKVKSDAAKLVSGKSSASTSSKNRLVSFQRGRFEAVIILRIQRAIRQGGIDGAQTEPLAGELTIERGGLGILQHAFHLLAQHLGLTQSLICGMMKQFLVRHGTPKEIGQATGEREVIQLGAFVFLAENRKCGETSTAFSPTRTACSNV